MQRILEPGEIEALDRTAIPRLRMPARAEVFSMRAQRLRQLAEGHPLADYLRLMATLVAAQQTLLNRCEVTRPDAVGIAHAQQHGMPLVPALGGYHLGRWQALLSLLLDEVSATSDLPAPVQDVITRLRNTDSATLDVAAEALLAGHARGVDAAWAPFLMAALQVLWTGVATTFQAGDVPMLDVPGVCPVCGTLPVASVVRIGGSYEGYRYLACGLCATEWHMVRVKCSLCEATEHVAYQTLDDGSPDRNQHPAVRAESCDDCHGYRKIFYQDQDPHVEPVADDLASLALDMLMGQAGFSRANGNPLLWQPPVD